MEETVTINLHSIVHHTILKSNVKEFLKQLSDQFNIPNLEYKDEKIINVFNVLDDDKDGVNISLNNYRYKSLGYREVKEEIESKIRNLDNM